MVVGLCFSISIVAVVVFVFEDPNAIRGREFFKAQPPIRVFVASVGIEGTMVSMDPVEETAIVSFGPNKTSTVGLRYLSCPKDTMLSFTTGKCEKSDHEVTK